MRMPAPTTIDLAVKHGHHGIRLLIIIGIVVVLAALALVLWRVARKRR